MNIQQTETEKNLIKALQGEALAHMKYTIYASLIGEQSKSMEKQILEIAHNEKEHWKIFAKLLLEDEYYDDEMNLIDAFMGEEKECYSLYPEFGRIARVEGFEEIADKFEEIAKIECNHRNQFDILLKSFDEGKNVSLWKCSNCGYIHKGDEAPEECPVCEHPKNYFE